MHDMLQETQDRVIVKLNEQASMDAPAEAIDPAVWAGILSTVLDIIKECIKKRNGDVAGTAQAIKDPSLIQRLRVRKKLISSMGRKAFRQHGEAVHAALMDVANESTKEDREQLVLQVQSHA